MKDPGVIDLSGWTSTSTNRIHLYGGWNFIAYNGDDGLSTDSSLNSISGKWVILWAWGEGQWSVKPLTNSIVLPLPSIISLSTGRAYWIKICPGMETDWIQ
jgi:hypothetical protein